MVFNISSNDNFESDQDAGMISLSALLRSFSAPVTEEHAWALIYQVTFLPQQFQISHYFAGGQ